MKINKIKLSNIIFCWALENGYLETLELKDIQKLPFFPSGCESGRCHECGFEYSGCVCKHNKIHADLSFLVDRIVRDPWLLEGQHD